MRAPLDGLWLVLLATALPLAAVAQTPDLQAQIKPAGDSDLGIAPDSGGASSGPTSIPQGKFYVEDAATFWSLRAPVVPLPPGVSVPDWQNRTSLDGRDQWKLAQGLNVTLSDRFNLFEQSNVTFPSIKSVGNDFREGFVSWEPAAQSYIEFGRINVKEGAALGYNPTDFFKTRSQVDQVSLDPSVLREDRLGAAMIRAEHIWSDSAISISYAPKLTTPNPISFSFQPTLNPGFGRTNSEHRILVTGSHDFGNDWNPELLYLRDASQNRVGADLSHGIGNSIIAYAEWAGGDQPRLTDAAFNFGKATGTLPFGFPNLAASDQSNSFRNDVAVGASWTPAPKLMFNLEYHYHQAGLSRNDLNNFFALGGASSIAATQFWYTRAYAAGQQEPLTRHEVFIRGEWADAFIPKLTLGAFAFVNLYDGSALAQAEARYDLSDAWTARALAGVSLGSGRSEHGSFYQSASGIFQLVRYF